MSSNTVYIPINGISILLLTISSTDNKIIGYIDNAIIEPIN